MRNECGRPDGRGTRADTVRIGFGQGGFSFLTCVKFGSNLLYMEEITVGQAAERAECSRQYIHELIGAGADGPFPSARKLDPGVSNSPYVIPLKEFQTWQKKRAQPA